MLKALLSLTRPANLVTAIADVLAGMAIAGYFMLPGLALAPVGWLSLATVGLYGGGVVFNDVFDAELDAVERPERPIPSGIINKNTAVLVGSALLIVGIATSFLVNQTAGFLAIAISIASLVYDRFGKHHNWLGPVNMGLCRGLNLLLGVSVLPEQVLPWAWVGLVPIAYIAAITMISRGEVHGGSPTILRVAGLLYALVIGCVAALAQRQQQLGTALPFLILFGYYIFPPLWRAVKDPTGPNIGLAVRAGVLSLIVMNAAWVASFASFPLAMLVFCLLPLSRLLAKVFAVT
ncbi:UbiA-like protein EboC [Spirosoma endophyticum]|uniref:4-hydroxybenzoate polyprenyltransferase n=1 Tax=Spirosoma endophyticum TaxID=662367 RepID=A0A1I1YUX9_9BACT|nr:UbiA-like protein EboC [Spirosoma endophyticum]SFE21963.1 4-hydroxybenzoate polyprenyltransferase [Spirosoma endophyticum]